MSVAIRAEGLVKRYKQTTALAGVDLEVPQGSVLGLLGPNGAGKTTAVRVFIFATLLHADEGRAAFVPVESMPSWLETFAAWNQITAMVDAVRGLTLGVVPGALPLDAAISRSLVWMAVIIAVFCPLALRRFRRTT